MGANESLRLRLRGLRPPRRHISEPLGYLCQNKYVSTLFSHIARTAPSLAAHDLECEQTDVTTAFLNGELDEDIYMQIPEGLRTAENEGMVCKLQSLCTG